MRIQSTFYRISALALVSACCQIPLTGTTGAEPVVQITGPTEAEPGNLIILRTEGTVGTGHVWKVIPEEAQDKFLPVTDNKGQQAAVFASSKPGRYTFVLAVAEAGEAAIGSHTLLLGKPDPDPNPNPPDPGPDPPDPEPDPGPTGLRVLILEETNDRDDLTESQLQILLSSEIRDYLDKKAAKGPEGTPEYRIWDDDLTAEELQFSSEIWRNAYQQAKELSKGERPWLLVTNGEAGVSMPLPKTVEETLAVLKKYGGE